MKKTQPMKPLTSFAQISTLKNTIYCLNFYKNPMTLVKSIASSITETFIIDNL